MFEGLAIERMKDGEDENVMSHNLDNPKGKPVSVPACLQFCIVCSLLGAFVRDIQNKRRVSLIYS